MLRSRVRVPLSLHIIEMPIKFSVYILYSEVFDKYYSGQSSDRLARLDTHNKGQNNSTKRYMPWRVFAYQELDSRTEAMVMERKLKNLRSLSKMMDFIKSNEFIICIVEGRE